MFRSNNNNSLLAHYKPLLFRIHNPVNKVPIMLVGICWDDLLVGHSLSRWELGGNSKILPAHWRRPLIFTNY